MGSRRIAALPLLTIGLGGIAFAAGIGQVLRLRGEMGLLYCGAS